MKTVLDVLTEIEMESEKKQRERQRQRIWEDKNRCGMGGKSEKIQIQCFAFRALTPMSRKTNPLSRKRTSRIAMLA